MNDNATVPDIAGHDIGPIINPDYAKTLSIDEKLNYIIASVDALNQRVSKLEQMADLVISLAHGMENNPMFKMFAKKK